MLKALNKNSISNKTRTFSNSSSSEKGISTVELALALPLFITLIFGALQISHRINSLQAVSAAANQGVKIASRYSNQIGSCPTAGAVSISQCDSSDRQIIPVDASLEQVANISTCNYLIDQGLDADNWKVATKLVNQVENGKNFPVIELSLKEIQPDCTFCIGQLSNMVTNSSKASMSINGCLVTDV